MRTIAQPARTLVSAMMCVALGFTSSRIARAETPMPTSGQMDRASLSEAAIKATAIASGALFAAAKAQAGGMASDVASLSRMAALPAAAMKWGQLRNPWVEGQFMDVAIEGAGKSARVGLIIPSIPKSLCLESLVEWSMRPELDRVEFGSLAYKSGSDWKIDEPERICAQLEAGPVRVWAKVGGLVER